MRIPRRVQIAARTYLVKMVDVVRTSGEDQHEVDGLITHGDVPRSEYKPYHIYLGRGTDELRRATTFLHELIHGVDLHYCGGALDEQVTDALAEGLMQAIRGSGIDFRAPETNG